MFALVKLGFLIVNIIGIFLFFIEGWLSFAIFLIFMFIFQLFVYASNKKYKGRTHFASRSRIATFVIYFIVLAIISRAINLQIVNGNYYRDKEYEQVSSDFVKSGKRGTIYDSNMTKMAFNINVYNVIIDPTRIYQNNAVNLVLQELIDKKYLHVNMKQLKKEIEELALKGNRYKVIEKKIDEIDKIAISDILKSNKLKNNEIFFERILERKYYKGSTYFNLIGNIGYPPNSKGVIKVGNFGIEKYYEEYLREKYLKIKTFFTKTRDIKLPMSEEVVEKSLNGKNVYLTIDNEINFILNTELEKQFLSTKAEEAYAVVMDPNNGKILATSYFSQKKKDIRNPIFQDQFEPGSIFKPLIISAAMEEKYITPETRFNVGEGTITRFGHTIKEASRGTRGIINTGDIINKSSNVGMVLVSEYFTEEKFEEYLRKYGFYDRTGVDFPSELRPYAASYKKWDKLKKPTMAFGQGIAVTPIQLITAFSAIVNGGTLYKPYIVDKIVDQDGTVIRRNTPKEVRRVISPETSEKIKIMLENNVAIGSGKKAIVNGYRTGGKTGTAQLSAPGGGYLKNTYLSSFIGVLPMEKPEYTVLIMILKPQADTIYGRFGSSVAAPVFGEIVARITSSKNMKSTNVASFSSFKENKNNNIENKLSKEVEILNKDLMPNLVGKSLTEVFKIFENTRFKIDIKGSGVVTKQLPLPNENIYELDKIKLEFGEREAKK